MTSSIGMTTSKIFSSICIDWMREPRLALDLVLVAGVGVHDVPLAGAAERVVRRFRLWLWLRARARLRRGFGTSGSASAAGSASSASAAASSSVATSSSPPRPPSRRRSRPRRASSATSSSASASHDRLRDRPRRASSSISSAVRSSPFAPASFAASSVASATSSAVVATLDGVLGQHLGGRQASVASSVVCSSLHDRPSLVLPEVRAAGGPAGGGRASERPCRTPSRSSADQDRRGCGRPGKAGRALAVRLGSGEAATS